MGDRRGRNAVNFDDGPDLLAELRDGKWLDAQNFPPLEYAVPGILPEGMSLLVGPPKIGKSWFVLSLALAAADGGRALGGITVDTRPVLYLALEDGDRRLQDRCRKLLGPDPIPGRFEYLTRVMPGQALLTVEAWLELVTVDEPPLVILDTLGKVMPPALPGESAYQRDYRIGTALKRLADERPGMSLLINHHDRKAGSDDFVDSVSGTHGLAGSADTIITLTRLRHEAEGLLRVTGRDVPEGEYALRFVDGSAWVLDGDDLDQAAKHAREAKAVAGLGDRSAEVFAFVNRHPEGVRASDVEDALGPDTRRYLARLADAGRIDRPKRGFYTPVPTVPMSQSNTTQLGQRDSGDTHVTGGLS